MRRVGVAIGTLVVLSPVVFLLAGSAARNDGYTATLDFGELSLRAYRDIWSVREFTTGLKNSVVLCGAGALLTVALGAPAAYSLARMRPRGGRVLLVGAVATLLVPVVAYVLPLWMEFVWLQNHTPLRLLNTRGAVVLVYAAIPLPVAILLLRSFFLALPDSLLQAAESDGCTPFGAFRRVALPLAWPALLTVGLVSFLITWSDSYVAGVLLLDTDKATLSMSTVQLFLPGPAAGVLAALPVVVAFVAGQRLFVRGLAGWRMDG